MATKQKVSISLVRERVAELDQAARASRISRSAVVEEALALWRRERLKRALARGYQAAAGEDLVLAEDRLGSGVETLERE